MPFESWFRDKVGVPSPPLVKCDNNYFYSKLLSTICPCFKFIALTDETTLIRNLIAICRGE